MINRLEVEALETSYADLEEYADAMEEALHRIVAWSEAYPLDIFPEPDMKKAAAVLTAAGLSLDAIAAKCMRHVIEGVARIAHEALIDREAMQ